MNLKKKKSFFFFSQPELHCYLQKRNFTDRSEKEFTLLLMSPVTNKAPITISNVPPANKTVAKTIAL